MKADSAVGGTLALALVTLAVVGPFITVDPLAMPSVIDGRLLPPSASHLLGTDALSRDVLARLAHGAAASLQVAVVAVGIASVIGVAVGVGAGMSRGIIGELLRQAIDLALALPRIVVLLVLVATVGELSVTSLAVVIGATGWPPIARLVRGETLRLRNAGHVGAAHALGAPPVRLVVKEIIPGALPPALVAATLGVADAILLEAGLSFIGLGIRPPAPSWGNMLLESRDHLHAAPWLLLAPAVALVAATSAATLLGEALRRSLQPDTR